MSSCCNTDHHHESSKEDYYTCSMHPEIKEDKPGKCPKCGSMDLVKKSDLTGEKEPTGTLKKKFWQIGKADAQKKENHSDGHGGCC